LKGATVSTPAVRSHGHGCAGLWAAFRFMKKAPRRHRSPEVITTDGLRSYRAAMKSSDVGKAGGGTLGQQPGGERPPILFQRRERAMLRFRRMKSLQKFASVHANVHNHFNLERHLVDRQTYKERCSAALAEWGRVAS
jgi:putative transposase